MSDGTHIEWTDATLNVVNGCTVVSPGCEHCYAMRLAATRLQHHPSRAGLARMHNGHPQWTGEVRFNEKALLEPLHWRRPRKIFWNAHGDLFHEAVPDEWIDRCFAVMALTPHHTHQVLTKRPERMREYIKAFSWERVAANCRDERGHSVIHRHSISDLFRLFRLRTAFSYDRDASAWPIPNVWLGVSVEDQKRADERIPILLDTPAAVRWLSCEPLLGPVDLKRFLPAWREATRPEGEKFRTPEFFMTRCEHCGWIGSSECCLVYSNCDAGDADVGCPACERVIIADDFEAEINWVVAGGESGPGARPMHPDWARSLRDQCAAAGVPFLFKQWGNWTPSPDHFGSITACQSNGPACVAWPDGTIAHGSMEDHGGAGRMLHQVGKKVAGRLLDGVQHDGYPA